MTALHSVRWHRVAGLRPRLAAQLRVRRQPCRGETWLLLCGASGTRSVRLNAGAWRFVAALDGSLSVQALWERQLAQAGDPPTQDEVIELLTQLREARLLEFDRAADFDELLPQMERVQRPRGRATLLAWRIRLVDPSRLLDRLQGLGRRLFTPAALWLWTAAVALLLLLAMQHAPALWAHGLEWMATPRYALLAALLYVPVKLVHEAAHGLALRRWGGAVRDAGVTLMLGLPVPWLDASAATAFTQRHQRLLVGAAGMMAELALAAIALPLWLWLDDGLARDAAFVTLFITGVSTLLFNANPLQRLDGYYLLVDAFDLPNLAPRSRRWWSEALRRRLLRTGDDEPMPVAPGETPWLVAYAPLAWLYALGIAWVAATWLGSLALWLGLLGGALLGWQLGLRPALRLLAPLRRAALAQPGSALRWRRLCVGAAFSGLVLLALPLPQRAIVQGVVWPPEQAQLRSDEGGFVEAVHARDGDTVAAGTLVLQLANPRLQADLVRQTARVEALEAELFGALPGAGTLPGDARAGDARAELSAAQSELAHVMQRVEALQLRAKTAGVLVLPRTDDLPGSYVARGRLLGHLLTGAPPTVRVALPEHEADRLREAPRTVGVQLASGAGSVHAAQLLRDSHAAVRQLPSAALGDRHGGDIATDPRDRDATRALQPVVLFDVRLDTTPEGSAYIGERARVRLDAGFAPMATQLLAAARQRVLRSFNPTL